jgi:putative ABC transport system substrate-binding protein
MAEDLLPKLLEILRILLPEARRIGVLHNPANPSHPGMLRYLDGAAGGLAMVPVDLPRPEALDAAFAALLQDRPDAVIILTDNALLSMSERVIARMLAERVPCCGTFGGGAFIRAGALFDYGRDIAEARRRLGHFARRILEGARPAALPIEQPTLFALAIHLATARRLGITVPPALLARADEVVE